MITFSGLQRLVRALKIEKKLQEKQFLKVKSIFVDVGIVLNYNLLQIWHGFIFSMHLIAFSVDVVCKRSGGCSAAHHNELKFFLKENFYFHTTTLSQIILFRLNFLYNPALKVRKSQWYFSCLQLLQKNP